ncbi:Procollagen C-endopeptidase enhancer 2 [Chionoecetes opilio]|uniref:Procollagen C-endopeptidase enhancer 2 n=1 Tax=Chionoecetes opilio TaxID=41210 RepID=A0A8J4XYJ6_CHIOP|nr:Procollagen C-endopeptidase enhancer 2 [Chionoecetes opilio]
MGSGRDGGRDKTGGREESVLWMMEGLQQQVLGVLNATTTDMLARIEGLREEMREELTTAVQDMHIPASQSTQQPAEDKTAAVPGLEYPRILSHNDTLRSLCNGNKILHSTVGSLELVDGGAYSNYLQCSWELNFPQESSVNLSWDYIDIEADATCDYDWVQVLDTRDSQLVYGRKLCGRLNSTTIKLLNVKVHGTRRLLVSFQSDRSTQGRGFRMTYQAYSRPWILSHNDTLRSLCNGNKILNGTVGTLEVVNGGAYSNYLQCSWELNFPQESSVNLSWDYIDIEADATCGYDWVQVLDTRDSQLVYGRKLCGRLNPPSLKLLHVTVHGTRRLLCAVAVSNRFDVLGALEDPVELWDTFKRETLQAAKECIGERPRSRRGFVSTETLEKIEESRAARLAGNQDQHRALSRRTRTLLPRTLFRL